MQTLFRLRLLHHELHELLERQRRAVEAFERQRTQDLPPGFDQVQVGCRNVSSAFGGENSLTVSQMLAYAASQSNAGGSTWYGNVKATQQLAKDAFDAINN